MTEFSSDQNTGYLKVIKTSRGVSFVHFGLNGKIKSSQIILKIGIHKIKFTKSIKNSMHTSNFRFFKFSKSINQILLNFKKRLFPSFNIIQQTCFKTLN